MKSYFDNTQWVLLYNASQDAYHVETAEEYKSKPKNGYAVVSRHSSFHEATEAGRKRRQHSR